jgi:hypothetical protein
MRQYSACKLNNDIVRSSEIGQILGELPISNYSRIGRFHDNPLDVFASLNVIPKLLPVEVRFNLKILRDS